MCIVFCRFTKTVYYTTNRFTHFCLTTETQFTLISNNYLESSQELRVWYDAFK